MKLIRRYRLHGVFFGLLVVVLLWAWRSASPLAPGSADLERGIVSGEAVSGEETSTGLVRLLRRSVGRSELLSRCFATWRESQVKSLDPEREKQVMAVLQQHQEDPKSMPPSAAYGAITKLLRRR